MNKNFNNIVQALRNNKVNETELAKINSLILNNVGTVTKDLRENGFHSSGGNPKRFSDEVLAFLAAEYKESPVKNELFWMPESTSDIRKYQLLVAREYVVLHTDERSDKSLVEKREIVNHKIALLSMQ
jgi:hypothetical protein